MSNPIPLTKPDSTVYAYACGACGCIGGGGTVVGGSSNWTAVPAEDSRGRAESCCRCRHCDTIERNCGSACKACQARIDAEWAAQRAAHVALAETSVAAESTEKWTLTLNGAVVEIGLDDSDYPCTFYTATARFRDPERPENNRDWSQPLQRNGIAALLHAAEEASYFLDAETVSLVPAGYVVVKAGAVEEAVAAEREACAQACDEYARSQSLGQGGFARSLAKIEDRMPRETAARICASKIRARGRTP